MNIGTTGIIIDQRGQLLVIKRDDTRTWAAPGGALDVGELPTEGVAREVEEETGFKVYPVRLVALDFLPLRGQGFLQFQFRCLVRGGAAQTSVESQAVGYTPTKPLGVPMLKIHKERTLIALQHKGGPPVWSNYTLTRSEQILSWCLFNLFYPTKDIYRWITRQPRYVAPADWVVNCAVVVRNAEGVVLLVKNAEQWGVPQGAVMSLEPPWGAAVRLVQAQTGYTVQLTDLSGVYVQAEQTLLLVFVAESLSAERGGNSAEITHLPPTELPPTINPHIREQIADATTPYRDITLFKHLG